MNDEEKSKTCKKGEYNTKECKTNQTSEYFCFIPPDRCYMSGSFRNYVKMNLNMKEKYIKTIRNLKKRKAIQSAHKKRNR